MANSNRTVFNWRNQKSVCVAQFDFNSSAEAETKAKELRTEGKRVRQSSYKYGSFKNTQRGYTVRVYEAT